MAASILRMTAVALLCIYLGAGLFAGLLMQRAIPALNPLGITYIALTWPREIQCARTESDCSSDPPGWLVPYLFSFGATP